MQDIPFSTAWDIALILFFCDLKNYFLKVRTLLHYLIFTHRSQTADFLETVSNKFFSMTISSLLILTMSPMN